ncbi:RNA exonuclease 1 homolog [Strix aluco]|uniref:RNA exonuclease 1 homolog n=1 Tax=Strix aluco TaxID=111821 RepID=UPI003DA5ABD2
MQNENAKQQCKPMEEFPCENQDGNSKMSQFRSSHVLTKRSRGSLVKIEIKVEESDEDCDLVIDAPQQPVNKKPRMSRSCTSGNSATELAAVICAEKLHDSAIADILGYTGEKSEKIITSQKNRKHLNESEKPGYVSSKANEIYLPNVNTDIWKVLEEKDALAYSKDKHQSSAASVEADMQKQENVENNTLVKTFVQEHTSNEDCVNSRRVTKSVLHTGRSSKNKPTIKRPCKATIINTKKSQSIEENGGNDSPEDRHSYPTNYLNKKKSEITLQSLSAKKAEPSGKDTDLSESDDPLEECQRIFDEFERELQKKGLQKQANRAEVDLNLLETKVSVPGQKRRIAQMSKCNVCNKKEMVPFKASPGKQGHYAEIHQAHRKAVVSAAAVKRRQTSITTTSGEKKTMSGLSATPFQSTGQRASLNLCEVQPVETSSGQRPVPLAGNVVRRLPRGLSFRSLMKRHLVPHKVSTRKRHSVPESGSKVSPETRQRYINVFLTECFKTCSTVNDAINKAVTEEQSVYDRCGSKKMYLNFAVKTLKKLRDHGGLSNSRSSSHAGSTKSEEEKAFADGALYRLLEDYLLTEEQLKENNFPRPNPEKNGSAIFTGVVKSAGYDAFKRVCCRCGKVYAVTTSGEHTRKEECNYHSGRVLEEKVLGGVEKRYSCCETIVGSAGCQTAKLHVHDGRREKLEGFTKTVIKSPPLDGKYGVYALNCETCYTTHGLELTRVTVVDAKLQVVYDSFVKPDGKVVDCDKRLSGVTKDDLKNITTSFQSVQAILLNLFSADTILIGHSLENDLFALKLIHDRVVDTSVVFPYRLGLPHKTELRCLMADYLSRIHQDDGDGHNSRQDAIACMELILWKVKEDNKRRKL